MRKNLREHVREAVKDARYSSELKEDLKSIAGGAASIASGALNTTLKTLGVLTLLRVLQPPFPNTVPSIATMFYGEKGQIRDVPDLKKKNITINITGTGK